MTNAIDAGLEKIRQTPDGGNLDRLETAVWARVDARACGDIFKGHFIQAELAVTAAALVVGFLLAGLIGGGMPMHSETAILSDDSYLAPSVRLEGGA